VVNPLSRAQVLAVEYFVNALLLNPIDVPILLFCLLPLTILESSVYAVAEVRTKLDVRTSLGFLYKCTG